MPAENTSIDWPRLQEALRLARSRLEYAEKENLELRQRLEDAGAEIGELNEHFHAHKLGTLATVARKRAAGRNYARKRIEQLEAELEAARAAGAALVASVDALIADSDGVYGLHLNGDVAHWGELVTGGEFENWLKALDVARGAFIREAPEPAA